MESTFVKRHAELTALRGVLESIAAYAGTSVVNSPGSESKDLDPFPLELAKSAKTLLDEVDKGQKRSNLGLRLRGMDPSLQKTNGATGKSIFLAHAKHERLAIKEICNKIVGFERGDSGSSSSWLQHAMDWEKVVVNGQEFQAYDHHHQGCHAVIRNCEGQDKVARIRRILEVDAPTNCQSLSTAESHSAARALYIVCTCFSEVSEDIRDIWKVVGYGGLIYRKPEDQVMLLPAASIRSEVVLTEVDKGSNELYIWLPHTKVSLRHIGFLVFDMVFKKIVLTSL